MNIFTKFILEPAKMIVPIQLQSVRFRYHADKLAKGKLIRRFGYEEKMLERGTIPHVDGSRLPHPIYRPKDMWNERRALFGQNDYIDILGNDSLHPTKILYDVPVWLRGFRGNEYQHCLRKKNMLRHGCENYEKPLKWHNLNKRIRFLYRFLNKKTKTGFTNKASG
ncbi:39S ribosomal protein L51, mitochondrial [Homalodisca vitripennis]|uniref:39S ribosomal protein L51, mitochondrial n=1 Tax=Homalodisca vitripennis TaxID=197043 RepID=UPI001EE9FC9E|nr:39S ribosomal protein L51, mitochondrial [Homalodisca vitripennis]KAG8251669.1 39S ribosomal protein L51, mitochondrial [Homalodisca vitripennis]